MLVFGSLRETSKRGYNFNRFGGQTRLRELQLEGYEMYDLKYYPAVCLGEGKIKVELHEVTDSAFKSIKSMEAGAGYTELSIPVEEGNATMFVMEKSKLQHRDKVESGDWE